MLSLVEPQPNLSEARQLLNVVEAWRLPPMPVSVRVLLLLLLIGVLLGAWPMVGFVVGSAAVLLVHRLITGRRERGPSGNR